MVLVIFLVHTIAVICSINSVNYFRCSLERVNGMAGCYAWILLRLSRIKSFAMLLRIVHSSSSSTSCSLDLYTS